MSLQASCLIFKPGAIWFFACASKLMFLLSESSRTLFFEIPSSLVMFIALSSNKSILTVTLASVLDHSDGVHSKFSLARPFSSSFRSDSGQIVRLRYLSPSHNLVVYCKVVAHSGDVVGIQIFVRTTFGSQEAFLLYHCDYWFDHHGTVKYCAIWVHFSGCVN